MVVASIVYWPKSQVTEAAIINPHPGLVGWWHFDEGSGSVARDSSGNGNNGTIYGATWVIGKNGQALSFNGINNYVLVTHSASLNVIDAITIVVWVRPSGAGTFRYISAKPSFDTNVPPYLLLGENNKVEFSCPSGISFGSLFSIATIPADTWTLIACTYSRTEGKQKIFINGNLDNSRDVNYALQQNTADLYIGAGGHGQGFTGIIDELRIYNRALSAAEIQSDFQKSPDFSSKLLAKVPKGTTQIITTLSWQGSGSINVTIASPSKNYTEDITPMYQKTVYSTTTSDMLNIKRLSISVNALLSDENWYIVLKFDDVDNYRITVEVQK
jgi:hypothetical protein